MTRRRTAGCLALVVAEALAIAGLAIGSARSRRAGADVAGANREVARALRLTSLALWSEPRHARHPAEADPLAAFGDHPAALDRFPAGSVVPPPRPQRPEGRR